MAKVQTRFNMISKQKKLKYFRLKPLLISLRLCLKPKTTPLYFTIPEFFSGSGGPRVGWGWAGITKFEIIIELN